MSAARAGARIGRVLQGPSDAGRVENGIRARHPVQCRAVTVPPYPCGMPRLRLAAAQLDLVVGDLAGNSARMLEAYERADAAGCDLIAFPELAVTGYPPEDLLLKPAFVAQATESLEKLAARTGRLAAVIGFPEAGRDLYNSAARLRERQGAGRVPQAPASRTTRCSTSSGTSRRPPSTGRCS